MYEMYPDAWPAPQADQRSGDDTSAPTPRRRARKEHQVAPRVLRVTRR